MNTTTATTANDVVAAGLVKALSREYRAILVLKLPIMKMLYLPNKPLEAVRMTVCLLILVLSEMNVLKKSELKGRELMLCCQEVILTSISFTNW